MYIYDGAISTVHIGVNSTQYDWAVMHQYLILLLSRSWIIVNHSDAAGYNNCEITPNLMHLWYNGAIFVLTLLSGL